MQQKQHQDPKFKPLPALNQNPSLKAYAKDKKLPSNPEMPSRAANEEKAEAWRLSIKSNKQNMTKGPLHQDGELRKSESYLTEVRQCNTYA